MSVVFEVSFSGGNAIDQYFKTANKRWSLYEYDHEETELTFQSFAFQLPIADLYNKVDLDAEKQEGNEQL